MKVTQDCRKYAKKCRMMRFIMESGGQELSYTHYTPINAMYSLRNRYLGIVI